MPFLDKTYALAVLAPVGKQALEADPSEALLDDEDPFSGKDTTVN